METPSPNAMQRAGAGALLLFHFLQVGLTEAQSGAVPCFRLQRQRKVAGESSAQPPSREPSTLLCSQAPRCSAAKETNIRSPLQPHFPSWAVSRLSFPSGESPKAILHGQENQGGNDKDPTMKVNRKQSDLWLLGSCSAKVGVGSMG